MRENTHTVTVLATTLDFSDRRKRTGIVGGVYKVTTDADASVGRAIQTAVLAYETSVVFDPSVDRTVGVVVDGTAFYTESETVSMIAWQFAEYDETRKLSDTEAAYRIRLGKLVKITEEIGETTTFERV